MNGIAPDEGGEGFPDPERAWWKPMEATENRLHARLGKHSMKGCGVIVCGAKRRLCMAKVVLERVEKVYPGAVKAVDNIQGPDLYPGYHSK